MTATDDEAIALDIVTTAEAARALQITEAAIWKWVERGWVTPINPGHKPLRFRYDDLARAQRDHRPKTWVRRHQAACRRWLAGEASRDLS